MKASACPRLFEVEAARDGRLVGAELSRFQSHLARCPSCSREAQSLDALSTSLAGLPDIPNDELHTRRGRTRLLAAFDTNLVPAPRSSKRWLVPLLAAAALTTLTLTLWHSRLPAISAPPRAREAIVIQPTASTEWSRQVESHRETITLTAGTLSVSIDHALSPRRVRVLLPDGELEDLGTTFTVTVTGPMTSHVSVQDGTVVLRLRDRSPIVLGANETWVPPAPPSPAPAASAPPAVSSRASAPSSARTAAGASAPERAAEEARETPLADAAALEFRAALSALSSGDHSRAASLFSAFLTRHPRDARSEDAAYLRVIALQRSGSTAATAAAARDYLRRFPDAFRRTEIEPLAQ